MKKLIKVMAMVMMGIFVVVANASAESESQYAVHVSAGYSLENGFSLDGYDSVVDDGNLFWEIGESDFFYNGYPVLAWFRGFQNPDIDIGNIEDTIHNPFELIMVNNMPLGEAINMIDHLWNLMEYEIGDNYFWTGCELNGSAFAQTDTYLSFRDGNILVEHGITAKGSAAGAAGVDINARLVIPESDNWYKILRESALYSSASVYTRFSYDYSVGESYQITLLEGTSNFGFGVSKELFASRSESTRSSIIANIFLSDLSLTTGTSELRESFESFGERNGLYLWAGINNDQIWSYGVAGAIHERKNVESVSRFKSRMETYSLLNGNKHENVYEKISSKYVVSGWETNFSGVFGLNWGSFTPFVGYSDDLNSGIISDWRFLKGMALSQDGDFKADVYLPLFTDHAFGDYFKKVYETSITPMFGADAKLDILRRELYSDAKGIYLHGESDSEVYRLGAFIGFENALFLSGGIKGFHDKDGNGFYTELGSKNIALFGEYLESEDSALNVSSQEFTAGLSGKVHDAMIELSYSENHRDDEKFSDADNYQVAFQVTIPF